MANQNLKTIYNVLLTVSTTAVCSIHTCGNHLIYYFHFLALARNAQRRTPIAKRSNKSLKSEERSVLILFPLSSYYLGDTA